MILHNKKMPKQLKKFDMLPLQYENIDDLKNNYMIYSFSIFDHWLTDREFFEEITTYQQIVNIKNEKSSLKYFEYEAKILNFYLDLYSNVDCYGVFLDNFYKCVYIRYNSKNEFKNHIKLWYQRANRDNYYHTRTIFCHI